jgi:bacterioferritin (cytochrome b1)
MADNNELIDELNRLLAEEVEASLRYLHLKGCLERGHARVLAILDETFRETIEHAEILGEKIRSLGGLPSLEIRLSCPPRKVTPADALHDALTVEEAALEAYQDLYDRVRENGKPAEILLFLKEQVEVETEHVEELRKILKEIGPAQ